MAKKRRKVFRRQADGSWKELKPRKAEQRAKKRSKRDLALLRAASRKAADSVELRALTREAAKAGAAEAIEHCANFWSVSDGFKKYIEYHVKTEAEALMAAVRTVVRDELTRVVLPGTRRKK